MERTIPPNDAPRIIDSPAQDAIGILDTLFSHCPQPRVRTQSAKYCGELLGRHLLNLLQSCGELNLSGRHSVAVTLFRPLEDSLDCLAAVTTLAGAAERWQSGKLKPSDAAKLWVERLNFKPITNETFSEYRRRLRSTFNPFSHCHPLVPDWDVFSEKHPDKDDLFRMRVNHENQVIISNAYRIDAFLAAHLWEVLAVIEYAYRDYFETQQEISDRLDLVKSEFHKLLSEHHKRGLLDTVYPPEVEALSANLEQKPKMRRIHKHWQGSWSCSSADEKQYGQLKLNQRDWGLVGTLTIKVLAGTITYKIAEQLSGTIEENRVILDGVSSKMTPAKGKIRYQLDTFELDLSEDGNELRGTHSCSLGSGEASFKRATSTH